MSRRPVALVSSEPVRPAMAGIGLRYLELARRLPELAGVPVRLVSPAAEEETRRALAAGGGPASEPRPELEVRTFRRGSLADVLDGCAGAVAQGQLANDVLLECPELPTAVDLYDPWLVENLHYTEELGLDPYRNDHATWVLQMSRGDFFLCSSEEQRTYYLGFLTALGRVNPESLAADPDLAGLVAPVPFGVPGELPLHRPWLPERPSLPGRPADGGRHRLLFGGLYDWYDPWTLLDALERLPPAVSPWTLYFIANPNPGSTPQRLLGEVEAECRRRGWWADDGDDEYVEAGPRRVELVDWVPGDRRYDLLRDVDLMVAPHRPSLETRLSLRTRFLDAAAALCPSVTSEGGAMSRLLEHHRAGWTVPPADPAALAAALEEALTDREAVQRRRRGAAELAAAFTWEEVLAPLVDWCRDPAADPTKDDFAFRPATQAPPDDLWFRARRFWRRNVARHLRDLDVEIRTGDDVRGGRR